MKARIRSLGSIQERLERTVAGEVIVSLIVLIVIGVGVVWSLPNSAIKNDVVPVTRPIAIGAGLDQSWGVFAPDPPQQVNTFQVHVLVKGDCQNVRIWNVPHGNGLYGQYSWYHLQKTKEWLLTPDSGINVPDFLNWVARQVTSKDEKVAYVELVWRRESLPAPGSHDAPKVEFPPVNGIPGLLYHLGPMGEELKAACAK